MRQRAAQETEARLIDDLIRRQVDGLIVASVFARPDLVVRSRTEHADRLDRCSDRIPGFYASVGFNSQRGPLWQSSTDPSSRSRHGGVVGGVDSPSSDPRERGWEQTLEPPAWRKGLSRVDWSREEVTRAAAAS